MMAIFFIGIGTAAILTGMARSPIEIAIGLFFIGLFASIYHDRHCDACQGQKKVGRLGITACGAIWARRGGAIGYHVLYPRWRWRPDLFTWRWRAPGRRRIAAPKKENMMAAIAASPEARQAIG